LELENLNVIIKQTIQFKAQIKHRCDQNDLRQLEQNARNDIIRVISELVDNKKID